MLISLDIKNTDTNQERFRVEAGSAYVKQISKLTRESNIIGNMIREFYNVSRPDPVFTE